MLAKSVKMAGAAEGAMSRGASTLVAGPLCSGSVCAGRAWPAALCAGAGCGMGSAGMVCPFAWALRGGVMRRGCGRYLHELVASFCGACLPKPRQSKGKRAQCVAGSRAANDLHEMPIRHCLLGAMASMLQIPEFADRPRIAFGLGFSAWRVARIARGPTP